jgi:hypothetical protein
MQAPHVRSAILGCLLVVASGCATAPTPSPSAAAPSGSSAPSAGPTGSSAPSAGPTGSSAPSAGPTATLDPTWLTRPALTCGGDERFPPEALVGDGTAERGGDLAATALRDFLAGPDSEGFPFPDSGWFRVFETTSRVVFVAPGDLTAPWVMVAFEVGPSGVVIDRYGQCQARVAMPEGATAADWWVDPAAGVPGPEATTVAGFVRERACASGRSPEGRILDPLVLYTEAAVLVVYAIEDLPGGQDCQGNPAFPITLELAEPIGDRALLDGATFPPRDALVPPD